MITRSLLAEKPFDFASTPGKLPKTIRPLAYAIRIEPDVAKFTFTGSETITLQVEQPAREIVLNALEITVSEASVDGKVLPKSASTIDAKNELLKIALADDLAPGEHTLALKFAGKINQAGVGQFYGKYREQGGGAQKIFLGTQFEATDARRLFPCWDEPVFRATFQLTAVVPENWMAVSNMPITSETKVSHGREVAFAPTPAMASYLNVFCAGEFDAIQDEVEGVKLRIITTKGKAETGRYALESTKQILQYYNDYFGIAYPLPKLDQLAIPGGFGGAMENWGGITYYETALLFDPANSSAATRQRVYEVIAHEVAHQWFGDLVTMAWWDNLWLNEGFASWMGSKCTAKFNPRWEVWLEKNEPRDPTRRIGIPKEQAMEGDARATTHPIQQHIATEAEANSAFDDITYKKGQSFLRMLESFLGEDAFREGLRAYMAAHKYANTTTADLWNALAKSSSKPVADIAAAWTEQPGFPVVSVQRDGDRVHLAQERFTVGFHDDKNPLWQIPLIYRVDGEGAPTTLLMTGKAATLKGIPADRALNLNVGGTGYYRVAYDEPSFELLVATLPGMSVPDQTALLSDSWAFVQAGRQTLRAYTGLINRLPTTPELAVREQIINAFTYIDHLLAGAPEQEKFRAYARKTLRPTLDSVELSPKADEPTTTSLLRASLLRALGLFGDDDVIKRCRENFDAFLKNPADLAPDLRAPTFAVVMANGNAETWQKLHELGLQTTSTEEKQNYYEALAFAADPALIEKTLQIALSDELPTSRAVFLIGKISRETGRADLVWDFARAHLAAILAKVDTLSVNYVPGLFTFFADAKRLDELQDYAAGNLTVDSARGVQIASDEIRFRADFRTRLLQELRK